MTSLNCQSVGLVAVGLDSRAAVSQILAAQSVSCGLPHQLSAAIAVAVLLMING
jgi:hypothetical protein